MPPPKLGPIKKRKSSKRSADFLGGRANKSAPATPSDGNSPIKEEAVGVESGDDAEFGFDSQWGMPKI